MKPDPLQLWHAIGSLVSSGDHCSLCCPMTRVLIHSHRILSRDDTLHSRISGEIHTPGDSRVKTISSRMLPQTKQKVLSCVTVCAGPQASLGFGCLTSVLSPTPNQECLDNRRAKAWLLGLSDWDGDPRWPVSHCVEALRYSLGTFPPPMKRADCHSL